MEILIVIPAYNAAATLPDLIGGIHDALPTAGILLVDDGATDHTARVARACGVEVISHRHNRGKGEALRTGFAVAHTRTLDAVIQMDADLQHPPDHLPAFVEGFSKGLADIIVGRRTLRKSAMPLTRRVSNAMTSWIVSRLAGQPIPDSQCGFRLIARRVLDTVRPKSGGFAYESEFLVLAARAGFVIGSLPIPTLYKGESSAMRPWRDTARFVGMMTSTLLHEHRKSTPPRG